MINQLTDKTMSVKDGELAHIFDSSICGQHVFYLYEYDTYTHLCENNSISSCYLTIRKILTKDEIARYHDIYWTGYYAGKTNVQKAIKEALEIEN